MRGFFASLRMTIRKEAALRMTSKKARATTVILTLQVRMTAVVAGTLAEGGVYLFVEVGGFQELAGLRAVGGADQAVIVHHVDEVGGAAVADAQAALQERGAG